MTAKEYLTQAINLDKLINSKLKMLEKLQQMSTNLSGGNFEDRGRSQPSGEPPFVRCIEKIDSLEREINAEIDRYVDLCTEIKAKIDMLEDNNQQTVLIERYLNNRSWNEITGIMNYSRQHIDRIHGKALEKLEFEKDVT